MIKSINTSSLQRSNNLTDLLALACASGFDALELDMSAQNQIAPDIEFTPTDDLSGTLAQHHIKISALTHHHLDLFSLTQPNRTQSNIAAGQVEELIDTAHRCPGSPMVIIAAHLQHPIHAPLPNSYQDAFHRAFTTLQRLIVLADRLDVNIAFENPASSLLLSPLELRDLIDELNSPYIGLCFNPCNARYIGDPLDWLNIMDQRAHALHLPLPATDDSPHTQAHQQIIDTLQNWRPDAPAIYKNIPL